MTLNDEITFSAIIAVTKKTTANIAVVFLVTILFSHKMKYPYCLTKDFHYWR